MGYIGNRPTAVPLTSADIQDGVITAADLGADSVDSSELVDGSIDTSHIADDAVTADKLANAINTSIDAKLPLAGGTMTGTLTIEENMASDTQSTPETVASFGAKAASTGSDLSAGSGTRLELKIPSDDSPYAVTGAAISSIKELGNETNSSSALAFYTSQNDTTLDEYMRIDSSGNLLVGTTSTTINVSNFGLKIASSGIISSSANVDGASTATEHFGNAGQCRIMGDGDAENTNNSYGALSDERLKENITDANSQWNDIKELQIKNYNLIAYPDRTHIGVIAQDLEADNMSGLVQETKPEVEHIEIDSNFGTIEDDTDHPILDDEGNETGIYQQKVKTVNSKVKSVKYSVLYMKAIKALQESMERIEQLEAKVTALENA
jgi:hypothetical protein